MHMLMISSIALCCGSLLGTEKTNTPIDLSGLGKNLEWSATQGKNQQDINNLAKKYQTEIEALYDRESKGFVAHHGSSVFMNLKQSGHQLGSFLIGVYLMRAARRLGQYDHQRKKHHLPSGIQSVMWFAGLYNIFCPLYRLWRVGKGLREGRSSEKSALCQAHLSRDMFFRAVVAGLYMHKKSTCQKQRQKVQQQACPIIYGVPYSGMPLLQHPHGNSVMMNYQSNQDAPHVEEVDDD